MDGWTDGHPTDEVDGDGREGEGEGETPRGTMTRWGMQDPMGLTTGRELVALRMETPDALGSERWDGMGWGSWHVTLVSASSLQLGRLPTPHAGH